MGEVLGMVKTNPRLLTPLVINLGVAVPINIVVAVIYGLLSDKMGFLASIFLPVGLIILYFIDYFCNGLACSLIYDQVTTGDAQLGNATKRTLKAVPGIVVFATISGILDLITSYAQERRDILGTILLGIVRSIWTTATYVVMPSMVIEGLGFFPAFKRSKELMENDPTQVGVGYIAIGFVTTVLGIATIGSAYFLSNLVSGVSFILSGIVFFTMVNVYWSVSGYLRITYYTCFYLWASQCVVAQRADPALAPAPLRNAMAG
jgi:hypothetical protein